MPTPAFVVVRTDVTGDEGKQRIFGAFDSEVDAVTHAMQVADQMYGDFAVARVGAVTTNIVREGGIQAVRAEPVEESTAEQEAQ